MLKALSKRKKKQKRMTFGEMERKPQLPSCSPLPEIFLSIIRYVGSFPSYPGQFCFFFPLKPFSFALFLSLSLCPPLPFPLPLQCFLHSHMLLDQGVYKLATMKNLSNRLCTKWVYRERKKGRKAL